MKTYILLDGSGSMASNWEETIASLNSYVTELANNKETKNSKVTLAKFDSFEPFTLVREKQKASEWDTVTSKEIWPGGMTPLYDAIGKMCSLIKQKNTKRVTLVIITDGYENSSREFDKDSANKELQSLREKGYDVVFIGADFDAMSQSSSLGNAVGQTINMTKGSYVGTMNRMSGRAIAYAASGSVENFTDEDRKKAKGE